MVGSVFAVGYLVMLSVFPLLFVWSTSYKYTSREQFPILFRAISFYSACVLCLLHLFCSHHLTGVAVEKHIGAHLATYGKETLPRRRAT